MSQTVIVHTDGASRGNPGEAAIAFVIDGIEGGTLEFKKAIGIFSNNQAEYRALLAALEKIVELEINDAVINFRSDSELMIKQINGEYRVKDLNLRSLFDRVRAFCLKLESRHNKLQFGAVRREQNVRADRLANEALDNNYKNSSAA